MLSQYAEHVFRVDIDEVSIEHAKKKYVSEKITFKKGSCTEIPLPNQSVDVVVSFETIEHITEHDRMIEEVKRVLRPAGILILSTPDKCQYGDLLKDHNQFYLKELYPEELIALVKKYFLYTQVLGQGIYGASWISDNTHSIGSTYTFSQSSGQISPESRLLKPPYLIAISSDQELKNISSSFCEQTWWDGSGETIRKALKLLHNMGIGKIVKLLDTIGRGKILKLLDAKKK